MKFDCLIQGGWLITEENRYTAEKVWIGVRDGRVTEIANREIPVTSACETIDAENCVIMPGMVNGHCHGDMACSMGLGDGMTLNEQNAYFGQMDFLHGYLRDEDRVKARRMSYLAALRGGVTFICENMYWGMGLKSVETLRDSGIRGALSEDVRVTFLEPETFVPDEWLISFVEECRKADLIPILGTLSEEDFDTERLRRVYAKRDELGIRSTQHYAETDWRERIVRKKYGLRPVEYLYQNGFLNDRMIGSHCVHVNQAEVDMMAGTGVHVINTPLCEMKISDGVAPLGAYVRAGVNVGLGTDGAVWNNSSDMFREMKCAALLQSVNYGPRTLNERDVLRMATIGGARAFGVDDRIGSIAVGKEGDIVILDMNKPHLQPLRSAVRENVASTVAYNATAQDVRDVLVKGRVLLRNGRSTLLDEKRIMSDAVEVANRVAGQIPERMQNNA